MRRMSLVQAVIELLQRHWPLSAALEQVASAQALPGEGETPPQFVAQRTLEDWYYAFKQGGFEGLKPKPRSDRGKPRRLSAKQQQWILEQVRAFPGVPVKLLYRQWKQADPTLPALSAVYRWLEQNDLDAHGRRYLLRQNIPGPTKAFEAPGVNDLWIVDFSPGPFLALHPKTVATHLCLIIDDHSRLIPYAAYGLAADTQALLGCLKEALRRRGLPRKLYADNGGPFVNHHLRIVCANLGIRLIHSKVGRPWSRGKVERMFRTLQQDFEAGLRLPGQGVGSLEELNGKLARWLQEVYHPRDSRRHRRKPAGALRPRFAAVAAAWIRTWTWTGSATPASSGWCARTAPCASTTISTKSTWRCADSRCSWNWIPGSSTRSWSATRGRTSGPPARSTATSTARLGGGEVQP